jgi:hypothetical protein
MVTLRDQSGREEPQRWIEKSVLKSVTGAITCAAAGICQSGLFPGRDACVLIVSRPNGQKWRRAEGSPG